MKIIVLSGLPASGKTTWAKEYISKNTGTKRVNKDDLREMLDNGKYSEAREEFVLEVRDTIVELALSQGLDVIVDDTNLNPVHLERMWEIARKYDGCTIDSRFIDTPLSECIKRDAQRKNSVGKYVIESMYKRYIEL